MSRPASLKRLIRCAAFPALACGEVALLALMVVLLFVIGAANMAANAAIRAMAVVLPISKMLPGKEWYLLRTPNEARVAAQKETSR